MDMNDEILLLREQRTFFGLPSGSSTDACYILGHLRTIFTTVTRRSSLGGGVLHNESGCYPILD